MPRGAWRRRVLWLSFMESAATILIERAIYFFSHERLGYSEAQNLGLALLFGAAYTLGAARSHALARRLGDRRALCTLIVLLLVLHVVMAFAPAGALLVLTFASVGVLEGAKWPIVESYVGAGLSPEQQLGAVGRFNVSWALAVPLAIAASGPLIASGWPAALFALAAFFNVIALALLAGWPAHAPHIDHGHPSRRDPEKLARYSSLLAASRWTMLAGYALMFLLAPLLPVVFQRLGRPVTEATFWASCMDAVRLCTFAVLAAMPGWHGRSGPLWLAALGLPLGFCAVLASPSIAVVLAGELVFGVLAGVTYYAALYYAIVVQNAAVDAGGGHEGLIGLGLTLGPALGLLGDWLSRDGNNPFIGIALAAAPLILACWFGALRALVRVRAGVGTALSDRR